MRSEYQPGCVLHFQTEDGTLTATILDVFTPFTYSQVAVVRTNHAHNVGQTHLPKDFLLIAKLYDVRFMTERDGIFSKRINEQIEIPHPWSYELEVHAAENRHGFSYWDSRNFPDRPGYRELDQVVWENWIFHTAELCFRDEVASYRLCKSLQGRGIPHFYGSGFLDQSHSSTQRAVRTRFILLEYIQGAKSLRDAEPDSITPDIVTSLVNTAKSFTSFGVFHVDLNPGNILISSSPPRGAIIDFGAGGVRESMLEKDWEESVSQHDNGLQIARVIRHRLRGHDISNYPELHGDELGLMSKYG